MKNRWRAGSATLVAVAMLGCGRTAPAPTPVSPAPAAAPAPEVPPSIEEVRALHAAGQDDLYEHALKLLAASDVATTRGRAEALLGLFYDEQNRHDEAIPWLERAANDNPSIAAWLWLRIDTVPAVNRVIQFGSDTTAGPLGRLRITTLYAEEANVGATNGAYAYTISIPITELNEPEFVRMARALAKGGRDSLAGKVRMRLLTEFPQGRYTEESYGAVAQMTPSPLDALSRDHTIDLAQKLGNSGHYDQALDLLQRFAKRAPAEAATTDLRNLQLRSLFRSRHYADILQQYDAQALHDDPAMLLLRGHAAWRSGQPKVFLDALDTIEHDFPSSPEAVQAKVLRAKYYTSDEPKLDLAIDNLQRVIAAGAYGDEGENLWTLGWTQFLAGHLDDALHTLADYKTRYPDGDYLTNALFWTGKIQEKQGNTAARDAAWDELEKTFPYNYFSYRARTLRHQGLPGDEIANGNVFPDLDAALTTVKRYDTSRLDLIDDLTWLGLYRAAIPNIKLLIDGYPDNPAVTFMLADTYIDAGEPLRANALVQRSFRPFVRHGGSGVPHRMWEILYPLAYWDALEREGAKQHVDPYLLASIARQESMFEPSTVSNAGAVGIMQIMPAEATRIASAAGVDSPTRQQLFDPLVNIAIGAAEYAQKRSAMNGNDILAITAYNAGTDAVGRWLAATPVDDEDLFVESIPYNETRLYVKTVTRNRFEYRRIYENGAGSSQLQK